MSSHITSPNLFSSSGIYPIKNLEIDSSAREFAFITKIAKQAQILGIGESAHGSQGYILARTKLIKHLVERVGFRLILLESGFDKTRIVNKYLQACKHNSNIPDPKKALSKLSAMHQNISTVKLLKYLCRFNNVNPKDSVIFQGIDIWESPGRIEKLLKRQLS